jgi:predicted transcriptional regulator
VLKFVFYFTNFFKELFTIVNMVYMLPQEIEVWYIIPAVRKEMAKVLTGKYGFSYERAGRALGISKAAVSQYLSDKRANKVCLNVKTKREIAKSCDVVVGDEKAAMREILRVLKFMKENSCSCNVCKRYNKEVLGYCNCDYRY